MARIRYSYSQLQIYKVTHCPGSAISHIHSCDILISSFLGHKSRLKHRFQVPLLVTPLFSRCISPPPLRLWCSPSLGGQFLSRTPCAVYFPSLCQSGRHPSTPMGMLMSKPCKLASIILSSLYSLFSLEKARSLTVHPLRKYEQGFNAFESNTGKPHPLASKPAHSNKRRDGTTVSLTNYRPNTNTMWYGNISVGTPAAPYTGRSPFRVAQTQKLIMIANVQLSSTRGPPICSFLAHLARTAKDTISTILLKVPRRRI
jgi:hypothetical protein